MSTGWSWRGHAVTLGIAALGTGLASPWPTFAQDATRQGADQMLRLMSANAARQSRLECIKWGYTPLDSSRIIDACFDHMADTVVKVYRTTAGDPIAANVQFFVSPKGFPKIDFSSVGIQVAISTPTFSCYDWIPGSG